MNTSAKGILNIFVRIEDGVGVVKFFQLLDHLDLLVILRISDIVLLLES